MRIGTLIRVFAWFPVAALLGAVASAQENGSGYEALLRNLPWRCIGPAIMGGRIDAFAVVENRPSVMYVGTASGGVFKSVNHGTTWQSVFDSQPSLTIGDIAVAPSRPEVVWVGTGEANNRQSSSWGNGAYKSVDGGATWTHMGLDDTLHIGRVAIDPRNPDVVYVAAAGHLWGPNRERGLFKTSDGGRTWTNTLFINKDTGCIDVAIDPQDPDVLYAAAYQRRRAAFGFNGGGPGSGIYKSSDGGGTWKKLASGLPPGDTGRIGLCIYRRDPRIVYATIENASGGVFRSEDRGETWRRMSPTNQRPMYFSQIRVDPNDDQRIWVLGVSMYASTDGGRTFNTNVVSRVHPDHHALWINPADSNQLLLGCDGGMQWSYDGGRTWDYINTLPIAQFYSVAYDMRKPYWVYGGLQDNGSWGAPSGTLYSQGPTNDDWIRVGGGDGFHVQVDPTDFNTVYSESQNGRVARMNVTTGERKTIRPVPPPGEAPYRFDWNTPILISPHNPKKLYVGGNRLFISTDRGDSWRRTEDLSTSPDRGKLPIMGVVPGRETLSRNDGQATFGQIVTITESPVRAGTVYVGTDDGNLQVSRDDGLTWKNVATNVPGVPKGTYVSRVSASYQSPGRCYATFDGHRGNDFAPYVFVTDDFGESWQSLAGSLPEGAAVNVVREHPRSPNLLFAGTERGLFVSFDRGGRWLHVNAPLPAVRVDDIQIHPRENDLILATHGRGIWILDDITPLEQLAGKPVPTAPVLFDPRPAVAFRLAGSRGGGGHRIFVAPNPPSGALIQYYLPSGLPAGEQVKLTILDRDGKTVVRELSGLRADGGVNRLTWDLRWTSPAADAGIGPTGGQGQRRFGQAGAGGGSGGQGQGRAGQGAGGGGFGGLRGPRVLPGTYLVRLTVGKEQQTRPLRVEEDPRITLSSAELRARLDAQTRVLGLFRSAADARRSLQELRTRLGTLQSAPGLQAAPKPTRDVVAALAQKVGDLLARLTQARRGPAGQDAPPPQPETPEAPPPGGAVGGEQALTSRILALAASLEGITEPPSRAMRQEGDELANALRQILRELNDLDEKAIPALNRQLQEQQLPPLSPPARLALPR
jgi:photosystem II stability/assembly factor-like uncharacterized protein